MVGGRHLTFSYHRRLHLFRRLSGRCHENLGKGKNLLRLRQTIKKIHYKNCGRPLLWTGLGLPLIIGFYLMCLTLDCHFHRVVAAVGISDADDVDA